MLRTISESYEINFSRLFAENWNTASRGIPKTIARQIEEMEEKLHYTLDAKCFRPWENQYSLLSIQISGQMLERSKTQTIFVDEEFSQNVQSGNEDKMEKRCRQRTPTFLGLVQYKRNS